MNTENTAENAAPEGAESESAESVLSRRALLGYVGAGALGIAALAASSAPVWAAQGVSDVDILNFALNLEYLEAEYYTMTLTGKNLQQVGIGVEGRGTLGPTMGGGQLNFSDPMLAAVARELTFDEQQHVKFIRSVLGSRAVAKPALNLLGLGIGFGSDAEYLTVARAMEDTGTSAYIGASTMLQSKTILGAAARILADEAYHMGNVRLMIAQKNITVPRLDGVDILPPPAGNRFFFADNFGLTPPRTMEQVKAIVRPFFPNGMNV